MDNKKESLKANQEEILSNLPGEFQEDFKKNSGTTTTVNDKDEVSAIKAELVENPAVDDSAPAAEL